MIQGFNCSTYEQESLARNQWQQRIKDMVAAGGRRRVENGETLVYGADGLLCFEVYENIPAPVLIELK